MSIRDICCLRASMGDSHNLLDLWEADYGKKVSLTTANVAEVEVVVYFLISSVFALNSSTGLIPVCVH